MRSADDALLRRTAFRVAAQTTLAVAVAVFVLGAIALLVVLRNQHSDDDSLMAGAIAKADDVVDPPAGTWLVVLRGGVVTATPGIPAGAADEASLRGSAADRTSRSGDRRVDGREYRVRTEPSDDGAVQVVLDLREDHLQRARMLKALVLVGGLGLLAAAGIGAWLGRRAVVPLAGALARQRRFVADAGHELRTPLTLLSTRAQLIQRALRTGSDVAPDVDRLVRDAEHLAAILDDLLLAADPREHEAPEVVDLDVVVARAVESAGVEARDRGILLTTRSGGAARVLGSSTSLARAVTALLDNAVRHATGEVVVELRAERGLVELDVTDDGAGIAPEVLPTLFDRFATAPDRVVTGRRRYGLGLALVSEIAARHRGTITATSIGHGARFRLTLPGFPGDSKISPTS
ncbi:MAG TPA: HAMP domain-containing sensor histidine kinase [Umezawaea sp.]|nr:HAMP domain-containing sensor histidine kinase [Umezawaea sp.]